MKNHLNRSINEPIREGLSWHERWDRDDKGLIACWENGRELGKRDTGKAERAKCGELLKLEWTGGVLKKLKQDVVVHGTLFYLAKWQGLRGGHLNIDVDGEMRLVCSKTGQTVLYSAKLSELENQEKLTLES